MKILVLFPLLDPGIHLPREERGPDSPAGRGVVDELRNDGRFEVRVLGYRPLLFVQAHTNIEDVGYWN